jgi:hypothetical protein
MLAEISLKMSWKSTKKITEAKIMQNIINTALIMNGLYSLSNQIKQFNIDITGNCLYENENLPSV